MEKIEIDNVVIEFDRDRYSPTMVEALVSGNYEGAERRVLRQILTPGDRVFEVGSAIGVIAITCAKIVGSKNVIGFEANQSLIEDAQHNASLNSLDICYRNTILQNRVMWMGPGTKLDFYVSRDFWASSLAYDAAAVRKDQVETACFEDEIIRFGANCLVCDIEGGEVELLTFADLSCISKLVVEIHCNAAGRVNIYTMIRKLTFDGFQIDLDLSNFHTLVMHRGVTPPWSLS